MKIDVLRVIIGTLFFSFWYAVGFRDGIRVERKNGIKHAPEEDKAEEGDQKKESAAGKAADRDTRQTTATGLPTDYWDH